MRISDWSSDVCSSDLGHVERVDDPAGEEIVADLLGDLDRDIDLRFVGRRAEVRGADEVRRAEQRMVGRRRFGLEHVERGARDRSEEHTSELQSLMRISYAVFCLKKKTNKTYQPTN